MTNDNKLRLLLANGEARRVAGTETYLEDLMAELARRSIHVALLAPPPATPQPPLLSLPPGAPLFHSLEEAALWSPTVCLVNGRIPAAWEDQLCRSYPSAYFVHNYYGTCISGLKRHIYPAPEPCFRRLSPACLGLYLPRGCGGTNPSTMFRLYRSERAQQERLRQYRVLLTHSVAMRDEYLRHDFTPDRVRILPFACVPESRWQSATESPEARAWRAGDPVRVLFAGRFESVKGGAELIEACAHWASQGNREVKLTMAGDGDRRPAWQALAASWQTRAPKLSVQFPGWLSGPFREDAFRDHHVFAMPSLWPEPFGKGGMEAACYATPSVGFAIGGIPQWLHDGVNGCLADWKDQPVDNLAHALRRVFASAESYCQLRDGARQAARAFTTTAHCDSLLPLLMQLAEMTP